jgi:Kef-type K+ transport system membrane component KefB
VPVLADMAGWTMLSLGATIVAAVSTKALFKKLGLPAVVGFVTIGLVIRAADRQWGLLADSGGEMFVLLSNIGIACLLFRVGLESNLKGLALQLRRASLIWIGDFTVSGVLGFATAYCLLDLGLATSLIVATALTATSVGVSVATWQAENALDSRQGQLMVDVAELDDVSGVLMMAALFAILPLLEGGAAAGLGAAFGKTLGVFSLHLFAFLAFCYLFSHLVEERLTGFFGRVAPTNYLMILVVGLGFLIAGFAEALGFSVAIGAFFAGLLFSRDPQAVKVDGAFNSLYEFFSPFFFIHIGLNVQLQGLAPAVGLGLVLLIPAIAGKAIGNGLPCLYLEGRSAALLIGASMIPRAEIAMVIVQRSLDFGPSAMPPRVFAAMVFVSIVTCLLSPLIVTRLLRRRPQATAASSE